MPFIPFAATVGTWLGGSAALGGTVIAASAMALGSSIVSSVNQPSAPSLAPLPKAPSEADARKEAEAAQRDKARRRTSTILTDLGDESLLSTGAKTTGKTLLGQ